MQSVVGVKVSDAGLLTASGDLEPGLPVGLVSVKLLQSQPRPVALGLYPAEAVINAAARVRLMTRPIPTVAFVVRAPPPRGQVTREKRAAAFGVAEERFEHRANLPF